MKRGGDRVNQSTRQVVNWVKMRRENGGSWQEAVDSGKARDDRERGRRGDGTLKCKTDN